MIEPSDDTRRAWSWRHAVGKSGLPSNTRLVLWTLSLKMDATGGSCFPPVSEIVELTGLDKKTVLKHLDIANERGWIEISQHGFRGQRWKRNEYIAKWPGRDVQTLPVSPETDDEGGGAVPPRSENKVVELSHEGGGTVSHKVVEQLHQDKTLPTNLPTNLPIERERASEVEGREEKRKAIERAFEKAWQKWPTSIGDSRPTAFAVWLTLSPDERTAAFDEADRYAAEVKATGRKLLCSHAVYLREKRWERLPPRTEAKKSETLDAPAFGSLWSVARCKQLVTGPKAPIPAFTAFTQKWIDDGKATERVERLRMQAKYGWPALNTMHDRASLHQGVAVSAALEAFKDMMEPVPVNSERYQQWQRHHDECGWPWIPDPGKQPVVYFPAGGPEGLKAFEQAIRGNGNDGDR